MAGENLSIQSAEEFLESLKVGDIFWHTTTDCLKPDEVEGPCKIFYICEDLRGWEVYYEFKYEKKHSYISDITRSPHAVFLNEVDAILSLIVQQDEFRHDNGWQESHEKRTQAVRGM